MSALMDMLPQYATVTAAIGAASSSLVDATKAVDGGASNYGFPAIRRMAKTFISNEKKAGANVLGATTLISWLRANWLNGTPLEQQKAIAKAQIKIRLNTNTVGAYATTTAVNTERLGEVVRKIASGEILSNEESNEWSRFDLILTSIIDECYERADQQYRNLSKVSSAIVSVILALLGYWMYPSAFDCSFWLAVLVGLAATPFGPIAKDLTTKLSDVAKAVQTLRK